MDVETQTPDEQFSPDQLQGRNWERVLERFTEDMDPWAIDIVELAERYNQYIKRLDRLDLEIPARMAVVCATLLRMKAELMRETHTEAGPLDDHDEFQDEYYEEQQEEQDDPLQDIEIPEDTIRPPVKQKPERRVSLDELKDALEDAIDIQQQRRQRRERRVRDEEQFIDIEKDDIQEKLNNMMDRLKDYFSRGTSGVTFERILEREDREEKIDTFIQILHLETDEKIRCQQDEFFGDIEIYENS